MKINNIYWETKRNEEEIVSVNGVSITKMTSGDNRGEKAELAIGDVKAGDIMTVWFSDESQSAVERVSISNLQPKN